MTETITVLASIVLSGISSYFLTRYTAAKQQEGYYNKIKYDTEFQAYKDISEKIYVLIKTISSLKIPSTPIKEITIEEKQGYSDAIFNAQEALDSLGLELNKNVPFIEESVVIEIERLIGQYNSNFIHLLAYYSDSVNDHKKELEGFHIAPLKDIHDQWRRILRLIRQQLNKSSRK